jgi:hypothetical protein
MAYSGKQKRYPKGHPRGGQFMPKGASTASRRMFAGVKERAAVGVSRAIKKISRNEHGATLRDVRIVERMTSDKYGRRTSVTASYGGKRYRFGSTSGDVTNLLKNLTPAKHLTLKTVRAGRARIVRRRYMSSN